MPHTIVAILAVILGLRFLFYGKRNANEAKHRKTNRRVVSLVSKTCYIDGLILIANGAAFEFEALKGTEPYMVPLTFFVGMISLIEILFLYMSKQDDDTWRIFRTSAITGTLVLIVIFATSTVVFSPLFAVLQVAVLVVAQIVALIVVFDFRHPEETTWEDAGVDIVGPDPVDAV